jgi:hypothetical protein
LLYLLSYAPLVVKEDYTLAGILFSSLFIPKKKVPKYLLMWGAY